MRGCRVLYESIVQLDRALFRILFVWGSSVNVIQTSKRRLLTYLCFGRLISRAPTLLDGESFRRKAKSCRRRLREIQSWHQPWTRAVNERIACNKLRVPFRGEPFGDCIGQLPCTFWSWGEGINISRSQFNWRVTNQMFLEGRSKATNQLIIYWYLGFSRLHELHNYKQVLTCFVHYSFVLWFLCRSLHHGVLRARFIWSVQNSSTACECRYVKNFLNELNILTLD